MTSSTYTELRNQCEAVLEELETDRIDTLLESILDIERTQYQDKDGWKTSNITLVMCTGGPHIEIDTKNSLINGYWGSESCIISFRTDPCIKSKIDTLLEYIEDYV